MKIDHTRTRPATTSRREDLLRRALELTKDRAAQPPRGHRLLTLARGLARGLARHPERYGSVPGAPRIDRQS